MTKFFTASPVAFYDPEVGQVPERAVEITDAEWSALLEAQNQGKVIEANAGGYPIAVDPSPPSDDQRLNFCKLQAKALLLDTDWVELPSVLNTGSNPRLQNADEFLNYRSALRALAVNPVLNPLWPTKPTAVWSK